MRDPYLYPDSDVLMNKLNIRNQSEPDEAEADFVVFRLNEMAQNTLNIGRTQCKKGNENESRQSI